MKVLVACEFSGTVRDAFLKRGHDAISCDLLPTESKGPHYHGDVADILYSEDWDLMIAHPPCTYLCSSGIHWNRRIEGRAEKTEEALRFVEMLLDAPIGRICLENPVGIISTRIRLADQYIQPFEFGHPESKKTGLWLKGLPLLHPTETCEPEYYYFSGRMQARWRNQTPSGQNRLGPSDDRWAVRSKTYHGIADAMADQWSDLSHFPIQQELNL